MKDYFDKYVNGFDVGWREYFKYPVLQRESGFENPLSGDYEQVHLTFVRNDNFVHLPEYIPGVKSILLHGSYATGDAVPFSDIDLLVILDDRVQMSQAQIDTAIEELRRLCVRIFRSDPLMHHGLMFLNTSDLEAYDQGFLPIATLKLANCIYGDDKIRIQSVNLDRKDSYEQRLYNSLRALKRYAFNRWSYQNDYVLKRYISGILLTPAFFLAAQGKFVYKKASFDMCYNGFCHLPWEAVQMAESIRREWQPVSLNPVHRVALYWMKTRGQRLAPRLYYKNYRRFRSRLAGLQKAVDALFKALTEYTNQSL